MSQKIRIKLTAYEQENIARVSQKIVAAVKNCGLMIKGPIPLPKREKLFTVLRSPHANKTSREQFKIEKRKHIIDIHAPNSEAIQALKNLEIHGVDIELEM